MLGYWFIHKFSFFGWWFTVFSLSHSFKKLLSVVYKKLSNYIYKKETVRCIEIAVVCKSSMRVRASKEVGFCGDIYIKIKIADGKKESSCCSSSSSSKNTILTQHEENFLSLHAEQEKCSTSWLIDEHFANSFRFTCSLCCSALIFLHACSGKHKKTLAEPCYFYLYDSFLFSHSCVLSLHSLHSLKNRF